MRLRHRWRKRSGKTTLIALLQNLYPIKRENLYWEYDAQFIHYQSLRNCIGVIHNSSICFQYYRKYRFGRFVSNMQGILDLSKELGITEFVEKLPNGFGTQIGENGAMLSGGQNNVLPLLEPYIKIRKCC
jgi:ATP-binding cassette subfamily B protein